MKIAIDIRRIEDFGVGTYIRNLIQKLASRDRENEYLLFGDPEKASGVASFPANFQLVNCNRPASSLRMHMRLHLEVHRLLQGHGADVLHIPYTRTAPLVPCNYLMTVHDVAEFLPQYESLGGFQQSLRLRWIGRALRRAHGILAVSNATKGDIVNLFGVPPERITVVGNAIDARLIQRTRQEERLKTLERYQVTYPFLLYVGSAKPQKNVARLIEAFAVIKSELRDHPVYRNLRLLIIGDEISEHSNLRRAVVRTRMQNDVRFLGYLPVETLRVFYQSAEVFVFPSLHEGFGLPPLEAMAQGTPVVTSNVSSLPEVVGEAAVLVNPENVFEIARGVEQVLLNDDLKQQLRIRGRIHLERFSWDRSVEQVLDLYAQAAGKRRFVAAKPNAAA